MLSDMKYHLSIYNHDATNSTFGRLLSNDWKKAPLTYFGEAVDLA